MIEVVVDRFDTAEGLLILSLKGAAVEANWENLHKGMIVEARVTKTNKGGLDVEVDGIRGFLPIGQIDINRVEDAAIYVNQKLRVVVTEANQREKNLVVSRRELLEQERAEQQREDLGDARRGPGPPRRRPLGQGLRRVRRPRRRRRPAPRRRDELVARLRPVGPHQGRPGGRGQGPQDRPRDEEGQPRPQAAHAQPLGPGRGDVLAAGMTVKGKVTRLMDFGAFVELEPGIEGLIHISELSPNRVRRVADIVKPEQEVEVRILKIEPEAKKIALSLRPLPAPTAPEPRKRRRTTTPRPSQARAQGPPQGRPRRQRQAAVLRAGDSADCANHAGENANGRGG